ncbi:MAG: phosphatase PAP2-related protein [bacterium]
MKSFIDRQMRFFDNKEFVISLVEAMVLFGIALVVNYFAGTYASDHAGIAVGDVFLSNIPVVPVAGLFIYGSLVFWIFSMFVYMSHLQKLPFTLKTGALFILIRSVFINLTQIGPYADAVSVPATNLLSIFSFKGDLFFSGHTGFPLLMAFIFWEYKSLRWIFIGWSAGFALIVLLGHLHYSIDVASAVFITYTIFHLSQILLKKDVRFARHGISSTNATG